MDTKYLEYALADRRFYDRPHQDPTQRPSANVRRYELTYLESNIEWKSVESYGWQHHQPSLSVKLPDQGWKIHCSATLQNAQAILDITSKYCIERHYSFKFLPNSAAMLRSNMKYAHRGGSGKFITIYPPDARSCESILNELNELLQGFDGPYILSDLRWQDGPLYVRYGGFALKYVRDQYDELVPAITDPDGRLVPDLRQPAFRPPTWVEVPDFIAKQKELLHADGDDQPFPYKMIDALHFSNGGGVYKALNGNGAEIVVKEARPFAGITPDGRDAVSRLQRERDILQMLNESPYFAGILDYFEHSSHHFLVQEYVHGRTLNKELVERNPLVRANETQLDRATYRDWALGIVNEVQSAIEHLHSQRIVFGDLHPNNVLVLPDNSIKIIDFEMSYVEGQDDVVQPMGAPGFTPGDGRTGLSADLYSLACLKISIFLPLTVLLDLSAEKIEQLVAEAHDLFELPDSYCQSVLEVLRPRLNANNVGIHPLRAMEPIQQWGVHDVDGVEKIRSLIDLGIRESRQLSRSDRLYPGDIAQFSGDSFSIAHGPCGNLLTTAMSEEDKRLATEWVEHTIRRAPNVSVGLYDGLSGAASTFERLGLHSTADSWAERIYRAPFELLPSELFSGLAGIGLYMLERHRRNSDPASLEAINRIRQVMHDRLQVPNSSIHSENGQLHVATGKGGLMHGASGQSLFWIRAYEVLGHQQDLDDAKEALEQDISLLIDCPDGSLQLNEGWRRLPYIASGSTGVGLAIMRVASHSPEPRYEDLLAKITHAATAEFCIQSNLFNGRAGFIYYLLQLIESGRDYGQTREHLDAQVRRLQLHAIPHGVGIHFPGEQLLRLSTDWATGSAGVSNMLGLYADSLRGTHETTAPFLGMEIPLHRPKLNAERSVA
ncbi:class III lanthionine synthetase LanKC [Rhodococcus sp. ARC_M6]|uniref:class III lanthionine synthetase LanKC n=1 Tax=Rhodococcus sp. ARC_M6 TaxID=2928852 RepID=UPI001FB211DC|nr:class III lanthionine synthetase LanKC [Rhodococcus sp. ARC_M6]MCJ0906697.1 class III lanthionine synthetase LanKC [Rhodococcus sp. ARC_M6]